MLGESAQDVVAEPIFGFEFDVQGGCTITYVYKFYFGGRTSETL